MKVLILVLVFTLIFPIHVFATSSDSGLNTGVDDIIDLKITQKMAKEEIAKAALVRRNATKSRLEKIESLELLDQKDAYQRLSQNFLENIAWLKKTRSVYRENGNEGLISEREKRLDEVSKTLELIAHADDSESKRLEYSKSRIEDTIRVNQSTSKFLGGVSIASGLGFYFLGTLAWNLRLDKSYDSFTGIYSHTGVFSASSTFAIITGILFLASIIGLAKSFMQIRNAKKYQKNFESGFVFNSVAKSNALREESFWQNIYSQHPELSKEPETRIQELRNIVVENMGDTNIKKLVEEIDKVRVAFGNSECENTLTLGTENAKNIQAVKSEVVQAEFEAQALDEIQSAISVTKKHR